MTMRERQRAVQLYRGQIPSPGRPTVAWRQDRVRFWAAIERGVVNGHQDLQVGGHQSSRPTDSRNPGGRTSDVGVSVSPRA
jgi:hypothetical protein